MGQEAPRYWGHLDMPIRPGEPCQQQWQSAQEPHNIEKFDRLSYL